MLLKPQQKNCVKCDENAFDRLAEVQLHFKDVHQVDVNIRDIIVNDQSGAEEFHQESYSCNFCQNATFNSDEKRIQHVNEVHVPSKEAQYQCPKCLQFFKNSATFKKHQQADHSKGKIRHRI